MSLQQKYLSLQKEYENWYWKLRQTYTKDELLKLGLPLPEPRLEISGLGGGGMGGGFIPMPFVPSTAAPNVTLAQIERLEKLIQIAKREAMILVTRAANAIQSATFNYVNVNSIKADWVYNIYARVAGPNTEVVRINIPEDFKTRPPFALNKPSTKKNLQSAEEKPPMGSYGGYSVAGAIFRRLGADDIELQQELWDILVHFSGIRPDELEMMRSRSSKKKLDSIVQRLHKLRGEDAARFSHLVNLVMKKAAIRQGAPQWFIDMFSEERMDVKVEDPELAKSIKLNKDELVRQIRDPFTVMLGLDADKAEELALRLFKYFENLEHDNIVERGYEDGVNTTIQQLVDGVAGVLTDMSAEIKKLYVNPDKLFELIMNVITNFTQSVTEGRKSSIFEVIDTFKKLFTGFITEIKIKQKKGTLQPGDYEQPPRTGVSSSSSSSSGASAGGAAGGAASAAGGAAGGAASAAGGAMEGTSGKTMEPIETIELSPMSTNQANEAILNEFGKDIVRVSGLRFRGKMYNELSNLENQINKVNDELKDMIEDDDDEKTGENSPLLRETNRQPDGDDDDPNNPTFDVFVRGRWYRVRLGLLIAALVALGWGTVAIKNFIVKLDSVNHIDETEDPSLKPPPDAPPSMPPSMPEAPPVEDSSDDIDTNFPAANTTTTTTTTSTTDNLPEQNLEINLIDPSEEDIFLSGNRNEELQDWNQFSYVEPGFGLGENNPLYLQNVKEESKLMSHAFKQEEHPSKPAIKKLIRNYPEEYQPFWIPAIQAEYNDVKFEDAFANGRMQQQFTNPYGPVDNRRYTFENSQSIYFPENALHRYESQPVNIPEIQNYGMMYGLPRTYQPSMNNSYKAKQQERMYYPERIPNSYSLKY